jgi:hypothetical protein
VHISVVITIAYPRNPYWRGSLSTVDLLVLTSSDQLLLNENIIYFYTKEVTSMRRWTVLSLSPLLVFPGLPILYRGQTLANRTKPVQTNFTKKYLCTCHAVTLSLTKHYILFTFIPNKRPQWGGERYWAFLLC